VADFFSPLTKAGRLRQQAYSLYQEHVASGAIPTSNRFLFYELVQRGVISKSRTPSKPGAKGRRPDQDLIEALKDLRDVGLIPWAAIVDETRTVEVPWTRSTVVDWLRDVLKSEQPMLDPWPDGWPLVLTESRSLAGVLRAMLRNYRVGFAATNGQVGGFLHTDIAPLLEPDNTVLYLGDLDLAGGDIEANTRRVLEQKVGRLAWERLALTQAQVTQYNVPPNPKVDGRFSGGRGAHLAYETEALSQQVIVALVQARLDELLPEPLSDALDRERQEKDEQRDRLA